jgi:hypothetical protein
MANTTTTTKDQSIGGLWKRVSKESKKKYLYGKIEVDGKTVEFRVWPNKYKQVGDKRPDFRILPSDSLNRPTTTTSVKEQEEPVMEQENVDLI